MEHSSSHSSSALTYYIVYAVLLILLVLTVAAARVELGAWSTVVAMSIATVKAMLVFYYFMHLRDSSRLTSIFAAVGFVMLSILIFLMIADYVSRAWVGS
jgi:cytochrome c oxidase subunit 4